MNEPLSTVVYPVIAHALGVKERLDRGESPDLVQERRKLIELLRGDAAVQRLADYAGDGGAFLGARYALACWIDELFTVYCPDWASLWAGQVLEFELMGTRERNWKFWEQLDIALKRPGSARSTVTVGADALETFFLCVVLGFRGKYQQNPREVRAYVEEMRPQFSKAAPWRSPRDRGVTTRVEPLTGRQTLLRVLWVYGGALLGLLLLLLVLGIFSLNKAAG